MRSQLRIVYKWHFRPAKPVGTAACRRRAPRSADGHPLPWAGGDHDLSLVPCRSDADLQRGRTKVAGRKAEAPLLAVETRHCDGCDADFRPRPPMVALLRPGPPAERAYRRTVHIRQNSDRILSSMRPLPRLRARYRGGTVPRHSDASDTHFPTPPPMLAPLPPTPP